MSATGTPSDMLLECMRGGPHVECAYPWFVVFGRCACVFREKWHSGEYTAFVEQVCLPTEVSTAREAAAVDKSLSRL